MSRRRRQRQGVLDEWTWQTPERWSSRARRFNRALELAVIPVIISLFTLAFAVLEALIR
jgi:hypothetical protein